MPNRANKRIFEVKAKCGHVGRGKYIIISFAVIASNKKEAAKISRCFPRVKHDYKDAIIFVKEIDKETFERISTNNQNDPYLQCKNIQQQRMYCSNYHERLNIVCQEEIDYQERRKQRLKLIKRKAKQKKKIYRYDVRHNSEEI